VAARLRIIADTSAWVALIRGDGTVAESLLANAISSHQILVPDLVRYEILRGMQNEEQAKKFMRTLDKFESVVVGGVRLATIAAANYRKLRAKSITVRGSIDLLIATWCIENEIPVLHQDRDYGFIEKQLGLRVWRGE
jgi:predicted nucleic acid-binding protein